MERPIPGRRLSPWGAVARGLGVTLSTPAPGATFAAPAKIEIAADALGGAAVTRAEVFNGTSRLGETKSGGLNYVWSGAPAGAHLVSMRVTDKSGAVASSPPVLVRVGGVNFFRAINFNGPPTMIDGNLWEGRDTPNCAKKGNGFEMQEVELKPPTDPERAQMIRSSISSAEGTSVTLSDVPNGPYLIYLYVWDEGEPATFDLLLKGKAVQSSFTTAPGRWDRLGPWPVEVTDETIELKASRGGAHFSGIEVWRVGAPPPPPVPTATELIGGAGGAPFDERPPGAPYLVGFRVTTTTIVKSVQALYQKGGARTDGETMGVPQGNVLEVAAKPGYAVGGILAGGKSRVNAMKVIFMRISGNRLNPFDAYESDWIGGSRVMPETKLVGDGSPIVGIHGRRGSDVDALGLIFLK
jgi:hypothetical protein